MLRIYTSLISKEKNSGNEIFLPRTSNGAYRAVGNILNKNRNPDVSCHRVVRSSGEVCGYNRGMEEKARRLRAEGALVR